MREIPIAQTRLEGRLKPRAAAAFFHTLGRFVRGKRLGAIGGAIMLLMVVGALFAPVLAPYSPSEVSRRDRLQPPTAQHWFGTDQSGRDILSRLLYGAQISVGIGFGATLISTVLASAIGMFSAYKAGRADLTIQRFVDAVMALPTLVLLLAASFVVGRGALTLLVLMGFLFGVRSSRVVRGAALSVLQTEYLTAARAIGASDWRILFLHITPNVFAPVMVLSTVQLGAVILTEASLSFLNLGVPPPAISWGQMLALNSLPYMVQAPWIALAPGLALTAVVWAINMLGDALRDVLDPRMRRGGQTV